MAHNIEPVCFHLPCCLNGLNKIDTCIDPESVHKVYNILSCSISCRSRGERTAAKASSGGIILFETEFQGCHNVNQSHSMGIMKMEEEGIVTKTVFYF